MSDDPRPARWARFRFSVIGPLLAAPPARGALRPRLEALAARTWQHPITGQPTLLLLGAGTGGLALVGRATRRSRRA